MVSVLVRDGVGGSGEKKEESVGIVRDCRRVACQGPKVVGCWRRLLALESVFCLMGTDWGLLSRKQRKGTELAIV